MLLIVYDGWAALKPFDVVLVIVGPVVAICTTHIFSNSLVQLVALGQTADDARVARHARFESRFLLLAVPPLAVLLVLHLANVALTDAIRVVIWLEAALAHLLGRTGSSKLSLLRQLHALSVLAGLVISGRVLLHQVILELAEGTC